MRQHQRSGHRALRKGRVSIAGHHYVLTIVCHQRRRCFLEKRIAQTVADKLRDPTLWRDSAPLCWVLMPDHLHVLLELGTTGSLSRLVGRVKCITALSANRSVGRNQRVWATGSMIVHCGRKTIVSRSRGTFSRIR
jgi:putative transposase